MSIHCAVHVQAVVQMRAAAQLQIAQCAAAAEAQEVHVQEVQQELQRLQEQLAAVQQVSQKEQGNWWPVRSGRCC